MMKNLRNDEKVYWETDEVCGNCTSADLSASLGVSPELWTYTNNAGNQLIITQHSSSKTQNFSFNIQNSSFIINCEHSPFGKITRTTGDIANRFAFRFSSEYYDTETGLVYYNYRYYSPELGRWLSRDPIGEYGGLNLYAMVENNPLYWWDNLGLTEVLDIVINSYLPFDCDITYKDLQKGCEINVIQWKNVDGEWSLDGRRPGNPFYFNYSKQIDASYWDKENSVLTFHDETGAIDTNFMFIVVKVCTDKCTGNKNITVLAKRMWSSKDDWGFNGLTAADNEYYFDYIDNIINLGKTGLYKENMDIHGNGGAWKYDQHKIIIVPPVPNPIFKKVKK